MEPIVTVEGFKILQDPAQAWRLVSDYYKALGYHVVELPAIPKIEKQATEVKR